MATTAEPPPAVAPAAPTPMGDMDLSEVLDGFMAGTFTKAQMMDWFALYTAYQAFIHSAAMDVQASLVAKFGVPVDKAWLGNKSYEVAHALWEAGKRAGDILPNSPTPTTPNAAMSANNLAAINAPVGVVQ